jgi:hypothetical protein
MAWMSPQDGARQEMAAVSLMIGCALGALLVVGVPMWLAYADHSIWWLLLSSTAINLFGVPDPVTRYNQWRAAQFQGRLPSYMVYGCAVPLLFTSGIQCALYFAAKWLLS